MSRTIDLYAGLPTEVHLLQGIATALTYLPLGSGYRPGALRQDLHLAVPTATILRITAVLGPVEIRQSADDEIVFVLRVEGEDLYVYSARTGIALPATPQAPHPSQALSRTTFVTRPSDGSGLVGGYDLDDASRWTTIASRWEDL